MPSTKSVNRLSGLQEMEMNGDSYQRTDADCLIKWQ